MSMILADIAAKQNSWRTSMNIQEVDSPGKVGFLTVCCECEARLDSRINTIYADIDGEPFKAYYCRLCVPDDDGKSFLDREAEANANHRSK